MFSQLSFTCITFETMPMTGKAQTGWDIYFCGRKESRPRTWSSDFRAYVRVRSITPKALLHAVRPLESPLVLVLHLRVILVGISQGRQATVEAALRQAVNIIIHPLHGVTEGQRITVLIHVGRAGWPGNKGEDCSTWGLVMLKMTQQWNQTNGIKTNIFVLTKSYNVFHD